MSDNKTQITIADSIKNAMPEFAALLKATGTDPDKFKNNALMAIADKPEIRSGEVSSKSVFNVCSRAANDGVVLDNKEAALILGSVKRNGQWVKEAQYRLMAGGVMKIINRSPNIERIVCQLIYENDDFIVDFVTTDASVQHKITPESLKKGRGEVVGVYFTAKLVNGEWTSPEIMSVAEVNEVRDNFVQKNKEGKFSGMWEKSWGEAARKTVLHRARKRLPLEGKIMSVLDQDDDEIIDFDSETGEVFEQAAATTTKPAASKAASKVKAAVKAKVAEQEPPAAEEEPEELPMPNDEGAVDAEFEEIEEEEIPV